MRGWFSSPEQGLVFAVDPTVGAPETSGRLASLGPSRLDLVGSVEEENRWWGEIASGEETCVVRFTLDGEARIGDVVWLRASGVPRGAGGTDACRHDARRVLEGYFEDLQASRFADAAGRFAPDGIYSHPPYRPGNARVLWRGRDRIRDGFIHERGDSPVRQIITDFVQSGGRAFVRGVVEGIVNGGTFVATAELAGSGEIARYVAFYSALRF